MSIDYVLYKKTNNLSDQEYIEAADRYFGEMAQRKECDRRGENNEIRWFTYSLPGTFSHPQSDVRPAYKEMEEEKGERWVELWLMSDCIMITVRHADPITRAIAEGLHKSLGYRFWEDLIIEED